jgi:hypothetical protein
MTHAATQRNKDGPKYLFVITKTFDGLYRWKANGQEGEAVSFPAAQEAVREAMGS